MLPENQVCNIKQAEQLKEMTGNRNSYFVWWYEYEGKPHKLKRRGALLDSFSREYVDKKGLPAYTVSELALIILERKGISLIQTIITETIQFSVCGSAWKNTEAEARAEFLINGVSINHDRRFA